MANIITCANFGSIIGIQEQYPGTVAAGAVSSSILAVETRHDAFLRILHDNAPNPAPFDTAIPAGWAYNIGLQYTVPGTCAVEIELPAYPQLSLTGMGQTSFSNDTSYPDSISFTWDAQQAWTARETGKQLYAAWVNLYNQPVYTTVTVGGPGYGSAPVPKGMAGVTFMALTTVQPSDLSSLQASTLVGPVGISLT